MHYVLIYDVAADYLERRPQFRTEHLRLAWEATERGELVLAGVFDPPTQGMLLFEADSEDVPAAFAKADPYVLGGLVTKWQVRAWNTVVGERASQPVRPD